MKKVLIIDDDEINNFLASEVAKDVDVIQVCHVESNATLALNFLEAHKGCETFPDLILVDLNMPQMSGIEFIMQFESNFSILHPNSNIAVLSNSIDKREQRTAESYISVKEFVKKPITAEILERLLSTHSPT